MNKKLWLLFILFSLLLSACTQPEQTPPPTETPIAATPTNTPTPSAEPGFNLLVKATGEVKLKRENWSDYHPTALGAVLHRGDQLLPADGAEVVVLCDNLTLWHVPTGVQSGLNGCPQAEEPLLKRGDSLIINTRDVIDPSIPYIISPRMTRLLTNQPRLRWNEAIGATSYTVRIQGLSWETELTGTELVYPNDPPLERGKSYLLTVTADNGRSSTEEEPTRLGFVLLSNEEAEAVQANTAKLHNLDFPDEAKGLAQVHLYHTQNLIAESIDTLEKFAQNGSQTPATYRLLGDLYQHIGLSVLAEQHYTQAITLAEASNDIEGLAAAQAGLATVYKSLNNKDSERQWLEQAKSGYQTLGDTERVSQLEERLVELE